METTKESVNEDPQRLSGSRTMISIEIFDTESFMNGAKFNEKTTSVSVEWPNGQIPLDSRRERR